MPTGRSGFRRYFGHSAKKLSPVEAATLAGVVQSPVGFDPLVNPEAAQVRRDEVLAKMEAQDFITPEQYNKAVAKSVQDTLKPKQISNGCAESDYPFYCDYAVKQILNDPNYGKTLQDREDFLKRGGVVIRTAMQPKAQAAATNAVMNTIPPKDPSKKGAAIAMVTRRPVRSLRWPRTACGDQGQGQDHLQLRRRPEGWRHHRHAGGIDVQDLYDRGGHRGGRIPLPCLFDSADDKTFAAGPWGCTDNYFGPYTVSNSTSSGQFNMLRGTAFSVNTYFVGLEQAAGLCRTVDIAKRTGMTLANGGELPTVQSFTLGSVEVSPLALATSYATMANHGVYCKPHAITKITDERNSGKKIVSRSNRSADRRCRVVADSTTAILTAVVDGGIGGRTGAAMSLGRDVTGKTGTTDTSAAVWFAGYTPSLSTAVWVGDPRGGFKYPMKNVHQRVLLRSGLRFEPPGPIWKQAMQGALADTPPETFELQTLYGLRSARGGGSYIPPTTAATLHPP